MAQSGKSLQGDYTSADVKLLWMKSLVYNLSVMTLAFSIVIFVYSMIGIWVLNLATYTVGMLVYYHGVWVSALMGITSIMGISGYQNGVFNNYKARIHTIFVVISELAIIAGLTISIKAIVDMPVLVKNFPPRPLIWYTVKTYSANAQASLSATAYGGTIVIILFYTYFFCYCLMSGYTYYKASKNPNILVNKDGMVLDSTNTPQETQSIGENNYVYEEAEIVGKF